MVSIIIACFNGEKYIDECLSALLQQTYQNIEIIICDDCSTDNSKEKIKEWIKKDSRIKGIFLQENRYAAAARNKCIEKAKGEYIAIQDIDDISCVNRIERLVEAIEKEPELALVSSAMKVFHKAIGDTEDIIKRKTNHPNKWTFLNGIPFNHPATMFKAECLNAVGGYREGEKTRRIEDYDLFARLYANGYKGMNLDDCLYYYRQDYSCLARRTLQSRIQGIVPMHEDFKLLKVYPIALPFLFKPILGYFWQIIKYRNL